MSSFYVNPHINTIQQGYIFCSAYADTYQHCGVNGLIITPRCDLENGKVSTVHYLPVIPFQDWLLNDYYILLQAVSIKTLESEIKQLLSSNNISINILNHYSHERIIEIVKPKIKDKNLKTLSELLQCLSTFKLTSSPISQDFLEFIHSNKKISALGKTIINELISNKRKEYYLIPDWENEKHYHIVLLREVQKMSYDISNSIAQGMYYHQLTDLNWRDNLQSKQDSEFLMPVTCINSPFIEHIIQTFFLNFGRIGVDECIKIEDIIDLSKLKKS